MAFAMKMVGLTSVASVFKPIAGAHDVAVTAKADYSAAVEYGTSRSPAQPFARPGTKKALTHFSELESRASSLTALVSLLAHKIADEWREIVPVDTGHLRDSIEADE